MILSNEIKHFHHLGKFYWVEIARNKVILVTPTFPLLFSIESPGASESVFFMMAPFFSVLIINNPFIYSLMIQLSWSPNDLPPLRHPPELPQAEPHSTCFILPVWSSTYKIVSGHLDLSLHDRQRQKPYFVYFVSHTILSM